MSVVPPDENRKPVIIFQASGTPQAFIDVIELLAKSPGVQVLQVNDSRKCLAGIHDAGRGTVVFKIETRDELREALLALTQLRQEIRANLVKALAFDCIGDSKIDMVLRQKGCSEVISSAITSRAFHYKVNRWLSYVDAQWLKLKREAPRPGRVRGPDEESALRVPRKNRPTNESGREFEIRISPRTVTESRELVSSTSATQPAAAAVEIEADIPADWTIHGPAPQIGVVLETAEGTRHSARFRDLLNRELIIEMSDQNPGWESRDEALVLIRTVHTNPPLELRFKARIRATDDSTRSLLTLDLADASEEVLDVFCAVFIPRQKRILEFFEAAKGTYR